MCYTCNGEVFHYAGGILTGKVKSKKENSSDSEIMTKTGHNHLVFDVEPEG
jgi:hypothetical protein